jgi:hypothetical protein
MREVDDDIDAGIDERLTIARNLKRQITTCHLMHVETGMMRIDSSHQLEKGIGVDRTTNRAAHSATGTKDSDALCHATNIAP